MFSGNQSFQLFSDGSSFLEDSSTSSAEASAAPPPPPVEVFPANVSLPVKYTIEPVDFDGLTLLKGRVSTKEVFGLPSSDLVPHVYEGGLKLWEGSLDLVRTLQSEIKTNNLSFTGRRVLELGCGHGLPGILASLEGATSVHFQDFNAEVLQNLTILNTNANISNRKVESNGKSTDHRYFSGCWSQVHKLLPFIRNDSNEAQNQTGYDIILTAETIYSISSQNILYELIKKCMSIPHGVAYLAAKRYYFGVGGGTQQFLSIVEEDGFMVACLVAEVSDGISNVREVWKLSVK